MNVEANGLRFHVESDGEGPAVLLLHGFPDDGGVWRYQVPALAAGSTSSSAIASLGETGLVHPGDPT